MKEKADETENFKSWLFAAGCCIFHSLLIFPYRVSGLIYVELIEKYNIDRSQASTPMFMFTCVLGLSGPLIGIIGKKIGGETVVLFGCVIASVGIGANFFAEDIVTMVLLLGVLYGVGFSASIMLIPSILQKHFTKNYNSSSGIFHAGACFAGFIFPSIVVYLFQTYEISGSFLIFSGIMINSLPIVILIKMDSLKTSEILRKQQIGKCKIKQTEICNEVVENKLLQGHRNSSFGLNSSLSNPFIPAMNCSHSQEVHLKCCEEKHFIEETNTRETQSNMSSIKCNYSIEDLSSDLKYDSNAEEKRPDCTDASCGQALCFDCKNLANFTNMHKTQSNVSLTKCTDSTEDQSSDLKNQSIAEEISSDSTDASCEQDLCFDSKNHANKSDSQICSLKMIFSKKRSEQKKSIFINRSNRNRVTLFSLSNNVFLDLSFWIIIFINSFCVYFLTLVRTTLIDYSRDKKIPNDYETHILMIQAVFDMIGRLALVWVVDKRFITSTNFIIVGFVVVALAMGGITLSGGITALIIAASFFEASIGAIISALPGMLVECLEKDKIIIAMPCRQFLYVPMSFTSYPLIDFFRNKLNSYDGLYYLLIALCLMCSLITPLAARCSRKVKKKEEITNVA